MRNRVSLRSEPLGHSLLIFERSVLTKFEFSFNARDIDHKSDNGLEQLLLKVHRNIPWPRLWHPRLIDSGEAVNQSSEPFTVFDNARHAIYVHRCIIPGWNGGRSLVPTRGYIGVWPLKYNKHLLTILESPPLRIGPRHVAKQCPLR